MPGRILVGVDGSEGSARALRWALDEAKARGMLVDAVTVWESPNVYGEGFYEPEGEREIADTAHRRLDRQLAEVVGDRHDVEVHPIVYRGDPAEVLCRWSEDAQLLVVGSRGLGGFSGLVLGSVSTKCAHHSRCPVVVVPGHRSDSMSSQ